MVDKELLEAIGQMMDTKLSEIKSDMLQMKEEINAKLDKLEEDSQITRDGVNSLLDWAEECGNVIKLPLPKVK